MPVVELFPWHVLKGELGKRYYEMVTTSAAPDQGVFVSVDQPPAGATTYYGSRFFKRNIDDWSQTEIISEGTPIVHFSRDNEGWQVLTDQIDVAEIAFNPNERFNWHMYVKIGALDWWEGAEPAAMFETQIETINPATWWIQMICYRFSSAPLNLTSASIGRPYPFIVRETNTHLENFDYTPYVEARPPLGDGLTFVQLFKPERKPLIQKPISPFILRRI